MRILIIGGGVFLGAATLVAALARGHTLTVFNRGKARTHWPRGVDMLTGDRATEIDKLAGGQWDAVIDTCGYVPVDVEASSNMLSAIGRYLFVSSVSVYASTRHAPIVETDAVASADGIARDDRNLEHYGPQKAACEAVVQRAFGDRALIVRPGLIVGPGDRSGRFSYWPWRAAAGGEMLVPDVPPSEPLQFIDVRDLGAWMVTLLERGEHGVFNGTGPVAPEPDWTWPVLIDACRAEVASRGLPAAQAVPIGEQFLVDQKVEPWTELPLWLPGTDPDYAGFNRVDLQRAARTGLVTRPLRETIAAVLDEGLPEADDRRRKGKLALGREAELIALGRGA